MLQDKNIGWIRKRILYTAPEMQSLIYNGTVGAAGAETVGITSAEVTDVGMNTWVMAAGEFLNGYVRCPYDLDPAHEVGFKVLYTGNVASGTSVVTWILLQNAIAEGVAIALPATALDTAIPTLDLYADSDGVTSETDWLMQNTGRGIRNDIGLTPTQIEDGAMITFKLESDVVTLFTSLNFIGLEMDYTPKKMKGEGLLHPAPLTNTI